MMFFSAICWYERPGIRFATFGPGSAKVRGKASSSGGRLAETQRESYRFLWKMVGGLFCII